ncbi:galacturonan 1,4-alpha-galacturonidase [Ranunculus cassubicifolius]
MNRLPVEITADILSRLDICYLLRYRYVCKTWYNIISNPSFFILQAKQIPVSSSFISSSNVFVIHSTCDTDWETPLCLIQDFEEGRNIQIFQVSTFKKLKFPLTLTFSSSLISQSVIIGCCNGLLCLSAISIHPGYIIPTNPIYILNPITRDFHQLPEFMNLQCHKVFAGFGFDLKRQEYKVVLVGFYKGNDGRLTTEVWVYVLGSCSWRRGRGIRDVPNALFEAFQVNSSAFINGALHWITADIDSTILRPVILAFQVGIEEFGFVASPETFTVVNSTVNECLSKNYAVFVLDDCLSIVDCCSKGMVEVWSMRKYNVRASWEKIFSLHKETLWAPPCQSIFPLKIQKDGELLHVRDDRNLVSYDPKKNRGRLVKNLKNEILWNPAVQVFPLVPSVISPKFACNCL